MCLVLLSCVLSRACVCLLDCCSLPLPSLTCSLPLVLLLATSLSTSRLLQQLIYACISLDLCWYLDCAASIVLAAVGTHVSVIDACGTMAQARSASMSSCTRCTRSGTTRTRSARKPTHKALQSRPSDSPRRLSLSTRCHCRVYLVHLVYLVYLVYLVMSV